MKVVERKEDVKKGKKRNRKGVRNVILVTQMTRGSAGKTKRNGDMTLILTNMFMKIRSCFSLFYVHEKFT